MAEQEMRDTISALNHPLDQVRSTVKRLISPGGCAWHEIQTHESLLPFLIEETAEFVDTIDRQLPIEERASELGDVLYQVLLHAAIAERDDEGYGFASVAHLLNKKLIARHPHVFGDRGYLTVQELEAEWEQLKEDAAGQERGTRNVLEGIPAGMPTLARAAKVVERVKRAEQHSAISKGAESTGNTAEVEAEAGTGHESVPDQTPAEQEIGEAFLALVISANERGVDPDRSLRLAIARFAAQMQDN